MRGMGERSFGEAVVSEAYFFICSSFVCEAEHTLCLNKRIPNHRGEQSILEVLRRPGPEG